MIKQTSVKGKTNGELFRWSISYLETK